MLLFPLPVAPTRATIWPGLGIEVDVVQDGALGVVAEGDFFESDFTAEPAGA